MTERAPATPPFDWPSGCLVGCRPAAKMHRTDCPNVLTPMERMAVSDLADSLLDGFTVELSKFSTQTLLAIAEQRDRICPDGWMQHAIRDYVEAWR